MEFYLLCFYQKSIMNLFWDWTKGRHNYSPLQVKIHVHAMSQYWISGLTEPENTFISTLPYIALKGV